MRGVDQLLLDGEANWVPLGGLQVLSPPRAQLHILTL